MNKEPIQMTPGDDLHLTLLMAPQSLNFVTGQDREHLLAFGRAAFEAGQHQIAEPSAQIPEDAQIQALMRKHRIWIEHSTLFENDEPERELRAVQAEEHQFNAFVQDLIAATQLATAPQAVQPAVPFMHGIADGCGNAYFEEGCVAPEARDLQPEVDGLNSCLDDDERPYSVVPLYAHIAAQGLDALTQAARSVLAERARQIAAEGWTPEADDNYNPGVLALHGGLYACHTYDNLTKKRAPEGWLWDEKWWKPKDPRSNLVKAGALILAEIERIDRTYAAQAKQGGA